ncbi:MAG: fibronectin type III domain-containing protein [Planctomycetota bacterium]|nr:fibronectin type III domain-containing protein [Planctomycetota bacterium]
MGLSSALNVDASGPGTYSVSTDFTPATILAGTKINSYYLHADTLGKPSVFQHMKGSITFDNPILGIISTPSTLSSSDLLGSSSTFYPNTGRGTDQGTGHPDVFMISADRKTLTYDVETAPASDDLRIITSAGPLSPSGISSTFFKIPGVTLKGEGLAINAPSTVAVNKLEDANYAKLFAEKTGVVITPFNVDASRPGNYAASTDFTPSTILQGTLINSYYLHADVTGTPTTAKHMKGSITFDLPILGIISTDANLNASDLFGSSSTVYPKSGRASDVKSDFFSISADRKTLTYDLQTAPFSDDLRIITAAIPLSSTEINGTFLTIPGITLKGQALAINAPVTVAVNKFEDQSYAKFFAEKVGVTLSSALNVDASIAGTYSLTPSMTPATILAGTKVNSYYLHADTVGASTNFNHMKGTITFSTPILGVISTTANLNKSDYLGANGTFYPNAQRKAESPDAAHPDFFWISADRKTLTFDLQTSTASDDLRIITEAALASPMAYAYPELGSTSMAPNLPIFVVGPNVGVVALNWNAPAYNNNSAIMNYLVQYSTNNGNTWNTACSTSASDLNAKIVGLQPFVSYYFRVAAVNAQGVSSILAVNSYKLA